MISATYTDLYLKSQTRGLAERNERRRRQLEAIGADSPTARRSGRVTGAVTNAVRVLRYRRPAVS